MRNICILLAAILSLFSCQKVIDLDLNSANPKIVIEAPLEAGTHDFEVRVTKTGDFFSTEEPEAVLTATVFLKKENETPIELDNIGNGIFMLSDYTADENTTYTLTVTEDGVTYEASSFLPPVVPLDSLTFEIDDSPFRGDDPDSFLVYLHFQEPLNVENYYRLKSTVNGVPRLSGDVLLVLEDRLIDGNYIEIPIFTDTYELNDTVDVELFSMDQAMYDYFNTLDLLVAGGGSAAPTNPNTTWSGGALGYFGAYSASKMRIVIE